MHFSRIKGRSLARSTTAAISKGAQPALLLCGLLGIVSVVLVSSRTMATPNPTGSNPDEASGGQVARKAPPADLSVWWRWVRRHPEGPGTSIQGRQDHPVVQVSSDVTRP